MMAAHCRSIEHGRSIVEADSHSAVTYTLENLG
jgi:hypothetical protein